MVLPTTADQLETSSKAKEKPVEKPQAEKPKAAGGKGGRGGKKDASSKYEVSEAEEKEELPAVAKPPGHQDI